MWRAVKRCAKEYCLNCNIHGMRYLAEPGRHWSERLFWYVSCIYSWYVSVYLILETWNDFMGESAINFDMKTDFLHWNTPFPSVIVCESHTRRSYRKEFLDWALAKYKKKYPKFSKESNLMNLHNFDGKVDLISSGDYPSESLYELAMTMRYTCQELLSECYWNRRSFNCCEYFHPLPTEAGLCNAVNNIHTKGKTMDMISNMTTGPGNLTIIFGGPAKTYIVPPQEVMEVGLFKQDSLENNVHLKRIYVTEVKNDLLVRSATLPQRQCLFPEENMLSMYDKYSFNGCIVECRHHAYLKSCNCTAPLMPYAKPEQVCNYDGVKCIMANKKGDGWRTLRPSWADASEGLHCDCTLSCETMDIREIAGFTKYRRSGDRFGGIEIVLASLPTECLERVMVRTLLDLVVNVGGTVGLLMGASLLSVVEVFHFFALPLCRALVARFCGDCGCGEPPRPPPRASSADSPLAALPLRRARTDLKAQRASSGRDPETPAEALTLHGLMKIQPRMNYHPELPPSLTRTTKPVLLEQNFFQP